MWVSWCDDGVTVICDREQCKIDGAWWQEVVEPRGEPLQPGHLAAAFSEHILHSHG